MEHIFRQGLFSLLLATSFAICHAQPNSNYFQDFVLANHKVYVLHADGIVKIFDETGGKLLDVYSPKPKVSLLTLDRKGYVVIADSGNRVRRLNLANDWDEIANYRGTIYKVVFDNDNDCFLVTDKGILNVKTQKTYFPEKKLFQSEEALRGTNPWQSEDHDISAFMDSNNNLWVAFGHGEWGTDTFIWNTKESNFVSPGYWNIVPTYESDKRLFGRSGNFFEEYLVQMDRVYDQNKRLVRIDASEVYNTKDDSTYQRAENLHHKTRPNIKSLDELDWYNFYVGDFTFRPSDGKFYIITSEGLLTADHLDRNIKFEDLKRVKAFAFPKNIIKGYQYYNHQIHELKFKNNYPQTVTKLQFNSAGGLVMLLPWSGVWLFDGKKLKIIE